MMRRAAFLILAAATLAACSSGNDSSGDGGQLSVVAAFYPLEEAARGVGGDLVKVTSLTPAGQSPHDLELQARQVQTIEKADVVVFLGRGFQPQVDDAVKGAPGTVSRLDVLDTVKLLPVDQQLAGTSGDVDGEVLEGDVDPHVWLDPSRMITVVDAITERFATVDPAHASTYRDNSAAYLKNLTGLDGEYRSGLADCRSRVIVTSHRAFGYLANTYGLRQIPIAGISPEVEPDAKTLEAIAAEAKREGVTTIYLESIAPPKLTETVAKEIGAKLDLLDPVEGLTKKEIDKGATYASIMRENLGRLRSGLGCR
ncbi:MAG: metal ABC transporter substrate-binding protein [Acidimicrobiia bacterium]